MFRKSRPASAHCDSLEHTLPWEDESASSAATEGPTIIDTTIHAGRIPAFPLPGFKSAVFNELKVWGNDTPNEQQLARTSSPYTLFTFQNLQLRVSGALDGANNDSDAVAPRFLADKPLPCAETLYHSEAEPLYAATVTIEGQDFAMIVLLDILRGHRPTLATALGVVHPQFPANRRSYDVMASTARGFFHAGQLIVIHADLLPISRPWKNISLIA